MATKLTKVVARETRVIHRDRPVIVELCPPGIIRFRLKRFKASYSITVESGLDLAMKIEANRLMNERKKARDLRRAGL